MRNTPTLLLGYHAHRILGSGTLYALEDEISIGCSGTIYPHPVQLEPHYTPLNLPDVLEPNEQNKKRSQATVNTLKIPLDSFYKIWFHPDDEYAPSKGTSLFECLSSVPERSSFEISGNCRGVHIQLASSCADTQQIADMLKAIYPKSEVRHSRDEISQHLEKELTFIEAFPQPPYNRALTLPDELTDAPPSLLFQTLSNLPETSFGFYQIIFQIVSKENDWRANMRHIFAVERYIREGIDGYRKFLNSGYFSQNDPHISKAYSSNSLFAVCIRAGISSEKYAPTNFTKMKRVFDMFRYGDAPLQFVTSEDYEKNTSRKISDIIIRRETHRPGMIINSLELAKFFNISPGIMENSNLRLSKISGQNIRDVSTSKDSNLLGYNLYAGTSTPVKTPLIARYSHGCVLGDTGEGKTVFITNQAVQDIRAGHGVLVIDPHGELIDSIIPQIPENRINDVVLLDFSINKEYLPLFNPFHLFDRYTAGRAAEDHVLLFRKRYPQLGRIQENLIRHLFFAYCSVHELTLIDLKTLLSKSRAGERLRERVVHNLTNETSIKFWKEDFTSFNKATLSSIFNILDPFLLNESIAPLFYLKECVLHMPTALAERKIILAKIPIGSIGQEATSSIGSSILTALYIATMERVHLTLIDRPPFFGYIDEISRFLTKTVVDLLIDARKFRVGLTVALQQKGQVRDDLQEALGNCRTLICFRLDYDAARSIVGNFMGKVEIQDILSLPIGHAVCRINNEITTVTTLPPFEGGENEVSGKIRQISCHKYSIRRTELEKGLANMSSTSTHEEKKAERIIDTF